MPRAFSSSSTVERWPSVCAPSLIRTMRPASSGGSTAAARESAFSMFVPSVGMRELMASSGNDVRGGSSTAASRPKTTSPASSFSGFSVAVFATNSRAASEAPSPIESERSSA